MGPGGTVSGTFLGVSVSARYRQASKSGLGADPWSQLSFLKNCRDEPDQYSFYTATETENFAKYLVARFSVIKWFK
jgi:hypothetical protein